MVHALIRADGFMVMFTETRNTQWVHEAHAECEAYGRLKLEYWLFVYTAFCSQPDMGKRVHSQGADNGPSTKLRI